MFDIGLAEILIVSAVTLVVIGPKEIPNVVRGFVKTVRRLRAYVRDFQNGVDEFVDGTGVNELKNTYDTNWLDDYAVGGEEPDDKSNKKTPVKKSKAKKTMAKVKRDD